MCLLLCDIFFFSGLIVAIMVLGILYASRFGRGFPFFMKKQTLAKCSKRKDFWATNLVNGVRGLHRQYPDSGEQGGGCHCVHCVDLSIILRMQSRERCMDLQYKPQFQHSRSATLRSIMNLKELIFSPWSCSVKISKSWSCGVGVVNGTYLHTLVKGHIGCD